MQVTVRIGGTREAVRATLIELMATTTRTGAHTERLEDAPDDQVVRHRWTESEIAQRRLVDIAAMNAGQTRRRIR